MKTIPFLSALIAAFILYSCSSNDDNVQNNTITGSWTLVASTGTIAGINHQFNENTIIWSFNTNNTVTILNNNTDETLQSGFPSGTYPYNIANNDVVASCPKNITIDMAEFGCIAIYESEMDINQNIADGINYHFYKIVPTESN